MPLLYKAALFKKRLQPLRLITLSLLTLIIASTSYAEPLFTAEYQGTYGSMNIKMVRTLEQNGESYTLQSTATSFMAKINEVSQFSRQNTALIAGQYHYERKVFGVKKNEYLAFDWPQKQVHYTKGKKNVGSQTLSQHTLDPTLYQLQLQQDLILNPQQQRFSYTFARRNQTKTYHFERQAQETITFKGKQYLAVVLARTQSDSLKATRLWLIPELEYALAKIQHTEEDGDTYQVLLTHYSSNATFKAFLTPQSTREPHSTL
ncbi:DUF3108 domain-containing protein [Marinagarivorans algicola]|uniref:DUF3108 domain-containing protein n=1 Tax=Marinagarivorans algicola TaxID=1513270 RepID=UPI0006B44CB5|nr:DUF3108 domain-containing protein [Marinagarivorans algicola]